MEKQYSKTIYACFIGYVVQAIVNNFIPLLFLTFHKNYGIPMTEITALITFNFGMQLLVDVLSVTFVDRIGYRASMMIAHICATAGFVFLTVLPELYGNLGSCALCGLSVGIMWPGTFSKASAYIPKGGTAMFAMLALAGDVGCSGGPTLVGLISGTMGDNLRMGIMAGIAFPVLLLVGICLCRTYNFFEGKK